MTENRVVALRQKGAIDDPLTEILRTGARRLIAQAVEAEFEAFLGSTAELVLPDGRRRVVRHGHDPVRAIQTGIGPIEVQKPKARDRAASGERIRFTSNILPKWARRTKSLDALLPVLYLRGISAGDFQEALAALLGKDAPNLSAAVIARLKSEWEDEYRRWQKRDLSARHYVYVWADGVYLQTRMEPQAECMLVLMGATPEGKKELIGFQTGMRESGQSWKELLVDLKARGLSVAPQVAIGDGALGFWKALDEAFPTTRHGTVGNLVRGAGFPSGSDEAIAEHDGKLGLSLGPFAGRHFPLLSDLAQDQENELGRRLVAGEMASRPHGPSQLGVQGLDSIRGVDDFAHGRSEGEERNDLLPLSPPDLADRRIFAAP